jgi:hypothetical protein
MSIIDKQFFSISSNAGDLQNGTMKSRITFSFPQLVQNRYGVMETRIGVDHAVFPVSFYVINSTNNYLHFMDEYSNEEQFLDVSQGNYTARELAAELVSLYSFWSWTISDRNGKYTVAPSRLIRIYADSTIFPVLGLEEGREYHIAPGESIECPFPVNLFGTQRLIVQAPNIPCPNQSVEGHGFLLSLPANAPPFEEIVYDNATDDSCLLPPEFSTDSIEIHIVDDRGNFIDFNNIDWSIVLFVEYRHVMSEDRSSSLGDVIRNYESELLLAIAQKKKKAKHHHHSYNLRKKKDGKKKTKD